MSADAATQTSAVPLLAVRGLCVRFAARAGEVRAVDGVDLEVARGECLGLIGDSGVGKSQVLLACAGLSAPNAIVTGSVRLAGVERLGGGEDAWRGVRGRQVGFVFQDTAGALAPHLTIGAQLGGAVRAHANLSRTAAAARTRELLDRVRVPDPAARLRQYPHELSGGLRQRVLIALAIAGDPELLYADEPTSALDVTVQRQILDLFRELRRESGLALVLVTHDFRVAAGLCDRVAVMRAGRVVADGETVRRHGAPPHPFFAALPAARPQPDAPPRSAPPMDVPLLAARDLVVEYATAHGRLRAVDGVGFELASGDALGVVGESGCGKTSLARAIVRLLAPTAGRIEWLGRDLATLTRPELRAVRRELQLVFQDPVGSLDPRMTIGESVAEPLRVHHAELARDAVRERVSALLRRVGLGDDLAERYPHELSGGQCQRAAIARAMIVSPRALVCDEAVSALDVEVRAHVLDLLADLRRERGLALVFVSHDLRAVRRLCTRVMVMYLGRTMEVEAADALYRAPRHPYTRLLLESVAVADPALERARAPIDAGEPASSFAPPSGCVFRTRCAHAIAACATTVPVLEATGEGGAVACLRWRELPAFAAP